MGQKFKFGGDSYDTDDLSDNGKATLASLEFTKTRVQELTNMQALLRRAKNSYVDSLKKEMLSNKAGFLFDED